MTLKNLLIRAVLLSSLPTLSPIVTALENQETDFECFNRHPVGLCLMDEDAKNTVYKIMRQVEWDSFQSQGTFEGSSDDQRDGFIHLSKGSQLHRVIEKYYTNESRIYIAAFSSKDFKENLKWEDSFPHLYNSALNINSLKAVLRYEIPTLE